MPFGGSIVLDNLTLTAARLRKGLSPAALKTCWSLCNFFTPAATNSSRVPQACLHKAEQLWLFSEASSHLQLDAYRHLSLVRYLVRLEADPVNFFSCSNLCQACFIETFVTSKHLGSPFVTDLGKMPLFEANWDGSSWLCSLWVTALLKPFLD